MAAAGKQGEGLQLILRLYRSVVRLHQQKLPPGPMRDLGSSYARAEFQAHLRGKTTKPQWTEFVKQWRGYVAALGGQGPGGMGQAGQEVEALAEATTHTAERLHDYLSPEQQLRMEALKKEAAQLGQNMGRPAAAQGKEPAGSGV